MYLLCNINVWGIYSIEMMKCFLSDWLLWHWRPTRIWVLQKVKRDLLVKGKGALWCIEKWAKNEPTQPHKTPGTSKRLKITIMKDKRARVEAFHQELESKHGGKYSRPQYCLWAEVIDIGTHASEEESNLGTSFRNVMKTTTNSAISESCRRM